jgi:hypothetical protein
METRWSLYSRAQALQRHLQGEGIVIRAAVSTFLGVLFLNIKKSSDFPLVYYRFIITYYFEKLSTILLSTANTYTFDLTIIWTRKTTTSKLMSSNLSCYAMLRLSSEEN